MTRPQRTALLLLGMAVLAVLGGLFVLVANDLTSRDALSLEQSVRAAPLPTCTLAPSPTPPVYGPEHAIAFAKGFRYSPEQERNLAGLIGTVETASQELGHEVDPGGWWAEDRNGNRWVVGYSFQDEGHKTGATYKFLVDLDYRDILGYNEASITLLTFLRQQALARNVEPTPTVVRVPRGWGIRDYYTHWEYSATDRVQRIKTVSSGGKRLANPNGFLVIPLRLHNLAGAAETLNPGYYARFSLRDRRGEMAGVVSETSLLRPTALYCDAQNLPHFAKKGLPVQEDGLVDTALVFLLQPQAAAPYTLEITVYDGSIPHRYLISLED